MSIVAYVGLPGHGKSYGVVENVILPALESGRTVITNIPIVDDELKNDSKYDKGDLIYFDTQQHIEKPELFSNDEYPPGSVWVIDEAQLFWPSGTNLSKISKETKEFFQKHRHYVGEDGRSNEIVIVTQDLANVANFVRNLVEETYRAQKLIALGSTKKYRVDVYSGSVTGQKPSKNNLVRQLFGTYKQDVYKFYKSHTENKTDFAAGLEEKIDQRGVIWKSPFFKYGLPLFLILGFFSFYQVFLYFTAFNNTDDKVIDNSTPNNRIERNSVLKQPSLNRYLQYELNNDYLPLSDDWRIVGNINDKLILQSLTGVRVVHVSRCSTVRKTADQFCVINGQMVTWYSSTVQNDDSAREYKTIDTDIL